MSTVAGTGRVSEASGYDMLKAMVGIGIVCALFIVLTFEGTKPMIAINKAEALEKAIFNVIPGAVSKQTFAFDSIASFRPTDEANGNDVVYVGYGESGKVAGIAIEASGIGFADVIRILYGYNPVKEELTGFYVLESKETPGLGDKIEKDEVFLSNFDGMNVSLTDDHSSLRNPITTVKHGAKTNSWEIDGITGATISSRAIGNILRESTEQWLPLIKRGEEVFVNNQNQ